MTELGDIFVELGISHYLHDFLEQGFDTWETILDITESDFDHLGVKLGHRRKIQRRIANSRGLSSDRALASPRHSPGVDRAEESKSSSGKLDTKETAGNGNTTAAVPHGAKRKYRRHPKPDENAPERPPSAYVIFSNKMREELKGRNLSFTEIAKLVGENWQNLVPSEKEPYEQQAFGVKERYNNQLAEYKKTEQYRDYSLYLAEFKSKHSNSQQGMVAEAPSEVDAVKRPKLEAQPSTSSSGTGSSSASQHGGESSIIRGRVGSTASTNGQWYPESHVPQVAIMPKLTIALGASNIHGAPNSIISPAVLPGYRDSMCKTHQPLAWRDALRDESHQQQFPHPRNSGDSYVGDAVDPQQHPRRTDRNNPPPLLTSESTNSTGSSTYFTPRTPLEPPLERALPIPSTFYQKNSYDNQLAPLRPPSLSPQATPSNSQMSPSGVRTWSDFPPSMAPIRGYAKASSQQTAQTDPDSRYRDILPPTACEEDLIPISALLSLSKGR